MMGESGGYWDSRHDLKLKIAPWAFLLMFILFLLVLTVAIIMNVEQFQIELLIFIVIVWGLVAGTCHVYRWKARD